MKNIIKKIAIVAGSVLLLGSTVAGATLSDYPSIFIQDGKFNGSIVVGDKANAEDVIGAIDIATGLQYTNIKTTSISDGEVTSEGESYKIERTTNKLNLGDDIIEVATQIDKDDLPAVLADGVYRNDEGKDYEYEQTIDIHSQIFTATHDNDYNDDEIFIGLHYDDGSPVLTYELDFTSDAESNVGTGEKDGRLLDFEDTQLTIMGKRYDIVEATNESGGYFELMGGALLDTLEEGDTKTYTLAGKEYEVQAIIVSDEAVTTKLKINGEVTDAMEEDDTWKASDGTQIGIRSIMPNEAGEVTGGDIVEFYIGAEKLVLENNQEIEIGDEDIDDILVAITSSQIADDYDLDKIQLKWITEDELFVSEDDDAVMPGLGSVKLSYEGLTVSDEEIIQIGNDGDNTITINAPIKGDDSFELAVLYDNETGTGFDWAGDEYYQLILTPANNPATINYDDNINNYMVISNSDNFETVFLKVTGFDTTDGVDFEEEISGKTYEKKYTNESFEVLDMTFTVDSFDKINKIVSLTVSDDNFEGNTWYTPEGLRINFPNPGATTTDILFDEEVDDSGIERRNFIVTAQSDMLNDVEAHVDSISLDKIGETEESDEILYYLLDGEVNTKAIMDEGPDQHTATIYYPGGETYGNLYLAETGATFGVALEIENTAIIQKIEVGTAKLASEISNVESQNLLIVGGPCANKVAAEVMGISQVIPECLEGFEEGKAMIKLYDNGDNIAMIVAGMTAEDTRRAARVISNYEDYNLSGDEIEVTGVGLTNPIITSIS